jgi:RNA polymerase subunit RPABC4/transcription elongation factor Spt4
MDLETKEFSVFLRTVIKQCPNCHSSHLGVITPVFEGDSYVTPVLATARTNKTLEPTELLLVAPAVPLVVLRCAECHYIMTFAAEEMLVGYKEYLSKETENVQS